MQASTTTTTAATAEAAATDASATSGSTQQSVAAAATAPSDSLVLVDTSSLIFRAYYSMPPMHREADGMPVSAVLGFCNMLNSLVLNKMLRGERPRLILCLDPSGKNFRHEMYSAYKANRPEAPIDLVPQFSLIYEAARAYGMVTVKATGYEADDVIATLGRQALEENKSVDILSIDKDLWQLVTKPTDDGARIEMLDPITMTQVTHELVEEKWGVPPEKLGDVLALAGDSADNIPGVPGIGPKIAAQLISEFGTLDELLARSDEIPQTKRREKLQANAEQAKLSQGLVRLEHEIPLERLEVIPPREDMDTTSMPITDWRMEPMDADRILAFYDEMGFVTIKRRLLDRLEQQKVVSFRTPARDNVPTRRKKNTSFRDKKSTGMPDPEEYKDVPF